MPPKKKGNKKGNDEWASELGEVPDPIAAAAKEAKQEEASKVVEEDDIGGGGGLMAALRKNKSKKQKRGKPMQEDYEEGEDPTEMNELNGHVEVNGVEDLAAKAPVEATTDDLFAEPATKVKGGKSKQGKAEVKVAVADDEGSGGEEGTVKSKKEKEKEKKEREKQRKKENV